MRVGSERRRREEKDGGEEKVGKVKEGRTYMIEQVRVRVQGRGSRTCYIVQQQPQPAGVSPLRASEPRPRPRRGSRPSGPSADHGISASGARCAL